MRAITSLPPPAAKPTMRWIGRLGYFEASSCATAESANARTMALIRAKRSIGFSWSMIRRSGNRFSEKIMLPRKGLEPRDMNMQHGGLAVLERGEAAPDGGG